jgi:hypothetical protein
MDRKRRALGRMMLPNRVTPRHIPPARHGERVRRVAASRGHSPSRVRCEVLGEGRRECAGDVRQRARGRPHAIADLSIEQERVVVEMRDVGEAVCDVGFDALGEPRDGSSGAPRSPCGSSPLPRLRVWLSKAPVRPRGRTARAARPTWVRRSRSRSGSAEVGEGRAWTRRASPRGRVANSSDPRPLEFERKGTPRLGSARDRRHRSSGRDPPVVLRKRRRWRRPPSRREGARGSRQRPSPAIR